MFDPAERKLVTDLLEKLPRCPCGRLAVFDVSVYESDGPMPRCKDCEREAWRWDVAHKCKHVANSLPWADAAIKLDAYLNDQPQPFPLATD